MKCIVELFDDAPSRHLVRQAVPLIWRSPRGTNPGWMKIPCENEFGTCVGAE